MNRRGFIRGLVAFVAAPAIVRVTSLMPVRAFIDDGTLMPAYGGIYGELTAVVRRAFIPRVIVQIYTASPLLIDMIEKRAAA